LTSLPTTVIGWLAWKPDELDRAEMDAIREAGELDGRKFSSVVTANGVSLDYLLLPSTDDEWASWCEAHPPIGGRGNLRTWASSGRVSAATRPPPPPSNPETTKTCSICEVTKPVAKFYRCRDGFRAACRSCTNLATQRRKDKGSNSPHALRRREAAKLRVQGKRRCPGCELVLDLDDFARHASRLDGRQHRCRACSAEDHRRHLAARAARRAETVPSDPVCAPQSESVEGGSAQIERITA
jgi:hypothetical protein